MKSALIQELISKGIRDKDVLDAIRVVPREEFLPEHLHHRAYDDVALPIGLHQTISQPYVVAYMTERLQPKPTDVVLEIGSGSAYQAAVLAELVCKVYSVEIIPELAESARQILKKLHYRNVEVKLGNGRHGWPDHSPYDAIIVTCATEKVPPALIQQLKENGRMIIPLGPLHGQNLYLFEKHKGQITRTQDFGVQFVPMTGE